MFRFRLERQADQPPPKILPKDVNNLNEELGIITGDISGAAQPLVSCYPGVDQG